MADVKLRFAAQDYEHTRALFDGRVKAEGIDLEHVELFPAVTFPRMVAGKEFETSEMAMTIYVSTLDLPERPFVAIPVFPVRSFRHSAFFVRSDGSVQEPRDLIGKRVGEFFFYGHDAGLWAKGILSSEYGVAHDAYSYAYGGVGQPTPPLPWLPSRPPDHIRGEHIGAERTLDAMLEAGELDAIIAPVTPPSMLRGERKLRRLFEDYHAVESTYYRKTGIFPIMHTLVIRREVYDANPWIASSLYKAFGEAKEASIHRYAHGRVITHTSHTIPWLTTLVDEVQSLMGQDWWPYGLEPNRKVLDTFLEYHHQQGLSKKRYTPEDLFLPV
ncbi:MAG TPA: 4,5-dihydroxyphthalate decarboxylase [Chloroflexota bacterium]|nr:4,5-dihydroxyphthalate decarboxylase [Chloroflexota bacterium]